MCVFSLCIYYGAALPFILKFKFVPCRKGIRFIKDLTKKNMEIRRNLLPPTQRHPNFDSQKRCIKKTKQDGYIIFIPNLIQDVKKKKLFKNNKIQVAMQHFLYKVKSLISVIKTVNAAN